MADLKKLLDHPEYDKITDKLLMGDSAKDVAQYLRNKYERSDEAHLRLSVSLLEQFTKNYGTESEFMNKIVKDAKGGTLDKQISDSLLNNKTWKARINELVDDEIDIKKKVIHQFNMMEQRQEQIFDKIQENPGNTKLDYILTKYFELTSMLMEKADRIINKSPDQRIEHTYTVQLVEQHSSIIQEAVRKVISRLPPDQANEFMQLLSEELSTLNPPALPSAVTVKEMNKDVAKLESNIEILDAKLEESNA